MELILAKDEKLLKSWEYSKITQKKGPTKTKTLTVTDRRIIHDEESDTKLERIEIAKEDISSVDTLYGNLINKWALIAMCVSLALAVVGIVLIATGSPDARVAFLVVGFVGAIASLILYVKSLKNIEVYVIINKRTNEELAFACSSSTLVAQKQKKRKKKKIKLKVKVDHEIARDLTESVATLLFE